MADSGALRVRRARAHKAGDHSLCKRCAAVRGEGGPSQAITLLPPVVVPEIDPLTEMRALAARLAQAHEREPSNALLARELRMTLQELIGIEGTSGFDDLAAEYGPA